MFTDDQIAYTDVINLDMAKALDKVPHEKPLCKLVGVRDPLLAWLWSYLANRRHRAVIDAFASDWRYVVLVFHRDPLLALSFSSFLKMTLLTISVQISPFMQIMLNVIRNCLIQLSIPLYVDDAIKCCRKLLDPTDEAILQSDLNTIVDWSELWGMSYNASKCKHLAGNILSKSACEKLRPRCFS